jgi:hypothetical protein
MSQAHLFRAQIGPKPPSKSLDIPFCPSGCVAVKNSSGDTYFMKLDRGLNSPEVMELLWKWHQACDGLMKENESLKRQIKKLQGRTSI